MSARSAAVAAANLINQTLPVSPIDPTTGQSSEDVTLEMLRRDSIETSNPNQQKCIQSIQINSGFLSENKHYRIVLTIKI